MVKDAEAHAEEDAKIREEAEIRNGADSLVYQTEKLVREQGDKLDDAEKTAVEEALVELKTAMAGEDLDAIKEGTEKLMTASQTVSTKLYEQAAAEADPNAATGGAQDDDEVVDAEIIDDDEDES